MQHKNRLSAGIFGFWALFGLRDRERQRTYSSMRETSEPLRGPERATESPGAKRLFFRASEKPPSIGAALRRARKAAMTTTTSFQDRSGPLRRPERACRAPARHAGHRQSPRGAAWRWTLVQGRSESASARLPGTQGAGRDREALQSSGRLSRAPSKRSRSTTPTGQRLSGPGTVRFENAGYR